MKTKQIETEEEIPKRNHLICGYCPTFIYAHLEPNGEYNYFKELPICPRCRILKGARAPEIIADKDRLDEDLKEKNKLRQKKANDIAVEVAIATQEETQTKMIRN